MPGLCRFTFSRCRSPSYSKDAGPGRSHLPWYYPRWGAPHCAIVGEFEFGACDVNGWYNERKGRSIIHHGVTSGHIPNRVQLLTARHLPEHAPHKPHNHGPHLLDCCFCTKSDTHHIETNAEEVQQMVEQLQAGLAAGVQHWQCGIDVSRSCRCPRLGARYSIYFSSRPRRDIQIIPTRLSCQGLFPPLALPPTRGYP